MTEIINEPLTVFNVINSVQNSTLLLNYISIENDHFLFLVGSYTYIQLNYASIVRGRSNFVGFHSMFQSNYSFFSTGCKTCNAPQNFAINCENFTMNMDNLVSIQARSGFIMFYVGNITLKIFNITFYLPNDTPIGNFNVKIDKVSNIDLENIKLFYCLGNINTFIRTFNANNVKVRNSEFSNLYSVQGTAGVFLLLGDSNTLEVDNITIQTSFSYGFGALINCFASNNNSIIFKNSQFHNFSTIIFGNLAFELATVTIINCNFSNFSSKLGAFIFAINSKLILKNINFDLGDSIDEGFINVVFSDISISDSNFSNLKGPSGTFLLGISSIIILNNTIIEMSKSTTAMMLISTSKFFIIDSKFYDLKGGAIIMLESNNEVSIENCIFTNISLEKNGMIFIKMNNKLMIKNSRIISINCKGNGAVINSNEKNSISLINSTIFEVESNSKGVILILNSCKLSIYNCSFNGTSSQIAGGAIYATLAIVEIYGCLFEKSESRDGGWIFLNNSLLTIENTSLKNSKASNGASAISAFKSNISIISSDFKDVSHSSFSAGMKYAMISIKNKGYLNNWVLIEKSNFQSVGLNSNYLWFFETVDNLSLFSNNFFKNKCNQIIKAINSHLFINNSNFTQNKVNSLMEINNDNYSMKLNAKISNLLLIENVVEGSFLLTEGNITISLDSLIIHSNIKTSSIGNLFVFSKAQQINLFHINCLKNLAYSGKEYFFQFSNSIQINLSNFTISNNTLQFLKSENSTLNVSHISAIDNFICSFLTLKDSFLFLEKALFSGSNTQFIVKSPYNATTIFAYNSLLNLSNMSFIDIQTTGLHKEQFEIVSIDSSTLLMENLRFFNDLFYSVYVYNLNSVIISYCHFEIAKTQPKENAFGGVKIVNFYDKNYNLSISNSQFINLGSNQSISSLDYDNSNLGNGSSSIKISNCSFIENNAANGGAISLKGLTNTFVENSYFAKNKATYAQGLEQMTGLGGSFYSSCLVPDSCIITFKESKFQENTADSLGGGIFLQNYKISSLSEMIFLQNEATFLNVVNNSNMSAPFFLYVTYISVEDKESLYFDRYNQPNLISINNNEEIKLFFEIYDSDNFLCSYDLSASATLSLFDPTITLKETRVNVKEGQINFNRFGINGRLNESYTIQLELEGKFALKKNFIFYIRKCIRGEYYDKVLLTCMKCPFGTYSLDIPPIISSNPFQQEGIDICQICPENSKCEGSKIVPFANYWINSSNETILIEECPFSGACLHQSFENFMKPVLCAEGYQGDLCITCENGYAKDGFESNCLKCNWEAKEILIFIAKLLFMLIFVSFEIKSVLFEYQQDAKISGILIKIIRDHFNQISLIYSFSQIFELDESFFTFNQNLNDVITGSSLNFDCLYQNEDQKLDLFYFKSITLIISPIILHIFISISFLIFFFYKKIFLRKKVTFTFYFKTILIAFIVVCDTQYTQLLISFLKLFDCVPLDSNNSHTYLRFAPHIQCYTSEHIATGLSIGLPCLFFWILGLPISFFVMLYILKKKYSAKGRNLRHNPQKTIELQNKTIKLQSKTIELQNKTKELQSKTIELQSKTIEKKQTAKDEKIIAPGVFEIDSNAALMLSFLFYDYKEDRYYWTSVILIWKTIMSILVTFISNNSIHIIIFAFYIVLLIIYSKGKPYQDKSARLLIIVSFICNMASVILGQYIAEETKYKNEVVIVNLIIHVIFFVLALYFFVMEYDYQEILEKILNLLVQKEKNKFAKKIFDHLKKFDKTMKFNELSSEMIKSNEKQENLYKNVFIVKKNDEENSFRRKKSENEVMMSEDCKIRIKEKKTEEENVGLEEMASEIPNDEIQHQSPKGGFDFD